MVRKNKREKNGTDGCKFILTKTDYGTCVWIKEKNGTDECKFISTNVYGIPMIIVLRKQMVLTGVSSPIRITMLCT